MKAITAEEVINAGTLLNNVTAAGHNFKTYLHGETVYFITLYSSKVVEFTNGGN